MNETLDPALLLRAYAAGIFPMAETRDSTALHWIDPNERGIFPLDGFHISRSLRRAIRRTDYEARFNTDFEGVMRACAARETTWINDTILDLYCELHRRGHAHSQEIWQDGRLVGGVYGITLGSAYFGESMFSRKRDTSKIALAWLIDRLRRTGFTLFDTQFITPHLESLGAIEISRDDYHRRLQAAIKTPADIAALAAPQTRHSVLQRSTQTS